MSNKMQFFFSSLDFAANKDRVFTLLIKEGLNRHIGDFCAKKHRLARRCRTVCHIFVACRLIFGFAGVYRERRLRSATALSRARQSVTSASKRRAFSKQRLNVLPRRVERVEKPTSFRARNGYGIMTKSKLVKCLLQVVKFFASVQRNVCHIRRGANARFVSW